MNRAPFLTLAMTLALAACATATPYQAADHGYGYSEQKLESHRWRVSFTGNASTPHATVENALLYRAAELTLANGDDSFTMTTRSTEAQPRASGGGFSFGVGGFGFGGGGTGVGVGVGTSTGGGADTAAEAEVLMFKGPPPKNDAHSFDARQVKENLAPQIQRPEK